MLPVNFFGRVVDTPEGKKWIDTQVSFQVYYVAKSLLSLFIIREMSLYKIIIYNGT